MRSPTAARRRRGPTCWCRCSATSAAATRSGSPSGPAGILAAFAARDALAGRQVAVSLPDEEVVGSCEGTDDLGRLRVRTAAGERLLGAGEVVRVSH